jgi:hypothetical protein
MKELVLQSIEFKGYQADWHEWYPGLQGRTRGGFHLMNSFNRYYLKDHIL